MSEIKNLDVENSCRACMRTGIPLRSVLEEAIDGESFLNIIVSVLFTFLTKYSEIFSVYSGIIMR